MAPLSTGPWPDAIKRSFSIAGASGATPSFLNSFYGSWNRLLNAVFPPDSICEVVPQYSPANSFQDPWHSVYSVCYLFVYVNTLPVFFVQVKPQAEFAYHSMRQETDHQMRLCLREARETGCPIPVLYGVSAYGTKISIYKYYKDTKILQPKQILPDPLVLTNTAPQGRWCWDILEEEGAAKFRQIVEEVKIMSREVPFIT